jgi:hypothetical protein
MVSCGVSDTTIHQTSFQIAEQKILASITDTIIPQGIALAHYQSALISFFKNLIDDCYEKDARTM